MKRAILKGGTTRYK